MELIVLPANNGDCLLLRSDDGTAMLVDGGIKGSFREEVAPQLPELVPKEFLDLVCVSHIDNDHISGIVAYFEMLASDGGEPSSMPRMKELWHNNVSDQLGKKLGAEVSIVLESLKTLLDSDDGFRGATSATERIMGIPDANELSRLADEMEGVAVNARFTNRVVTAEGASGPIAFGSIEIQVIAPLQEQLQKLKEYWRDELRKHPEYRLLAEGVRETGRSSEAFHALAPILGDIGEVTTQNLASIMFLTRGENRTFLMTGDGHSDHILEGLRYVRAIDGGLHVDVLKVPHHGSENNMREAFCREVTADHYVFCGNGAYSNPHLDILDLIVNARDEVDEAPYSFWFSNSSATVGTEGQVKHMQSLEARVEALRERSGKRFAYHFRQPDEPHLVVPPAV